MFHEYPSLEGYLIWGRSKSNPTMLHQAKYSRIRRPCSQLALLEALTGRGLTRANFQRWNVSTVQIHVFACRTVLIGNDIRNVVCDHATDPGINSHTSFQL